MITQDACAFYQDHVVYKQFNGVVLAEEEGRKIAETLGGKKVSLANVQLCGEGRS